MVCIQGDFGFCSGSFILDIISTERIFLKRTLASSLDCQEKYQFKLKINFGSPGFLDSQFMPSFYTVTIFSECSSQKLFKMPFYRMRKTSCESSHSEKS